VSRSLMQQCLLNLASGWAQYTTCELAITDTRYRIVPVMAEWSSGRHRQISFTRRDEGLVGTPLRWWACFPGGGSEPGG
jgi:hypothetical protein